MHPDSYRIDHDGAYYVVSELGGRVVSPPCATRERAREILRALGSLSSEEQAMVRNGLSPAPGCDWLLPR